MLKHDGTAPAAFTNYLIAWNETAHPWIHPKDGVAARAIAVKIGDALQALRPERCNVNPANVNSPMFGGNSDGVNSGK